MKHVVLLDKLDHINFSFVVEKVRVLFINVQVPEHAFDSNEINHSSHEYTKVDCSKHFNHRNTKGALFVTAGQLKVKYPRFKLISHKLLNQISAPFSVIVRVLVHNLEHVVHKVISSAP